MKVCKRHVTRLHLMNILIKVFAYFVGLATISYKNHLLKFSIHCIILGTGNKFPIPHFS